MRYPLGTFSAICCRLIVGGFLGGGVGAITLKIRKISI